MTTLTITSPGRGRRIMRLDDGSYIAGRGEACHIRLDGAEVSSRHAIFSVSPEAVTVEDLGSANGTLVDGAEAAGRTPCTGRAVTIGAHTLVFARETAREPVLQRAAADVPERRPTGAEYTLRAQIQAELLKRIDMKKLALDGVDQAGLERIAHEKISQIIRERSLAGAIGGDVDKARLEKDVFNEAMRLGPIEDLLADDTVSEIMVNGPDRIYVERNGKISLTQQRFTSEAGLLAAIDRIVAPLGRRIDESQPYVDARLQDGSRVNAIIAPLSLTGPAVTIRKFSRKAFSPEDLVRCGSWSHNAAEFMKLCVKLRKNIVVAGGTGSGKTTLLNILSLFIPHDERIITVEDAAELRMQQPHVVRLEARPPNIEGKGAVTIRDLVRNCLRMRPDRIIVGECRGGEALDMLQAMNTGHDGSLTTVHANSPRDVISRLETMVMMSGMELPSRAIREQIASAVDIIIHISRYADGSRKVAAITEVSGLEGNQVVMQDIFTFSQEGFTADGRVAGRFKPTGAVPTWFDTLAGRALEIDPAIFDASSEVEAELHEWGNAQ